MKRITAWLLTLTMVILAAVPTVLAGGTGEEAAEQADPETVTEETADGTETVDGTETPEPSEEEAGEETAAPEPQPKPRDPKVPGASKPANLSGSAVFTQLRDDLKQYNANVRALMSASSEAEDMDSSGIEGAADQLDLLCSTVEHTLGQVQLAASSPELTEEQRLIYGALSVTLSADLTSLKSQSASLRGQVSSIDSTLATTQNTIMDSINQIVRGAETLYIGIITMEAAVQDVQRGLDSLDRAVAIREKQVQLGMASQYELETIRHQRSAVQSQLDGLRFQIKSSKITLESMLDMPLKGTVRLAPLTMPTAAELNGVSEGQLGYVVRRNLEVQKADDKRDTEDTVSSQRAYKAAIDNVTYRFKLICMAVPEQQRLVQAAEEEVAFQKRTLDIAKKKYELGMLSHEEYLAAESDLKNAESTRFNAQLDLFSAYRDYVWARDYGIV